MEPDLKALKKFQVRNLLKRTWRSCCPKKSETNLEEISLESGKESESDSSSDEDEEESDDDENESNQDEDEDDDSSDESDDDENKKKEDV